MTADMKPAGSNGTKNELVPLFTAHEPATRRTKTMQFKIILVISTMEKPEPETQPEPLPDLMPFWKMQAEAAKRITNNDRRKFAPATKQFKRFKK